MIEAAEQDSAIRRRVDESAKRILQWKHWVGLPDRKPLDYDECLAVVSDPRHKQTAVDIARGAVTAIRGEDFLRTLRNREHIVCIIGGQTRPLESPPANLTLSELVRRSWPAARLVELDAEPTGTQLQKMNAEAAKSDAVVFLGFTQVRNHDPDSVRFPKLQVRAIQQICESRPTAVICYGSPYALQDMTAAAALGCVYDKIPVCLQAGLDALTGSIPWTGRLPVRFKQ